jgi:hypothetical protein
MTIDEIISYLAHVRTNLWILKKTIASKEIIQELKSAILDIDMIGCELTQNIAKKLEQI